MNFICEPCKKQDHTHCVGKARCDCMHRPIKKGDVEPATGAPGE